MTDIRQHPTLDLSIDVNNGDLASGPYFSFFNTDTKRKFVPINHVQHDLARLVVECFLGRELSADEHVHHINGQTAHDSIVNLEVRDYPEPLPPVGTVPTASRDFKSSRTLGVWAR
ncbi:hypothetical protein ACTWJ8_30740 [Streptomyces sp. SDT5-1]|uniref:hypothetical protein n=1 Tax=Streptomyces sp. SDT5-1 TaxID=3406418 RepID=UPI003FD140CE